MRLSLRFILPLAVSLALVAYAVVPLVENLTLKWFVRDLDIRSSLITNTIQDRFVELAEGRSKAKTLTFFNRIIEDERLYAIGFCDRRQEQLLATRIFPQKISCDRLDPYLAEGGHLLDSESGPLHVSVREIRDDGDVLGDVIVVHDMSFVQRRSEETKKYLFYFFVALGLIVALITVVIAEMSWRGWVHGIRALLHGEGLLKPTGKPPSPELRPIARDLNTLIRDLRGDYGARDESQVTWTPEALRDILRRDLRGEDVIVVSNREPYMHVRRGGGIEIRRPASGLVTALEPVARACSGTWIAHGSGSADRLVVDARDRVGVPPEHPSYQLRRVWLTAEQEAGHYYGFANEGLWPLCHIAHVRPIFRTRDWEHYNEVNRKFADAVAQEAGTPDPIVLVQDYHFALLPRMIRERLPEATVITFWHIPWPNPETFSICPWRAELLDGLLGSSILGFHTQFHCNNFMDTVDRILEARVDRETFAVTYGGKTTSVNRYPISIEWPPAPALVARPVDECRAEIRRRHGLGPDALIGVGVDRLDYTKGIVERFLAVERLLELQPQWIGRFCFVQIAAPSRSVIEQYQELEVHMRALASRINNRFARGDWLPIVLLVEHHEPEQVAEYYRGCELCYVSSLHDGMNLVAKEFVASRDDERGVLILSLFTGASRELPEALIVNPYDVDQSAAALHAALTMPETEQRDRMRIMRSLIREFNVYRWAGRMLLDAAGMRVRGRLAERRT
jgi:trehalose 6-phosphate synthase